MLETHVLGVRRDFDVPSWRIPSLYFQYLRVGHVGHVLPVFDHNEHDLLSLMALTGHVSRILDSPDEADLQAAELFGLAKLYEDLGKYAESLRIYERGMALNPSGELRSAALRRLSLLYKYLQQRDEAVAIWASLAAEGTHLMFPYLELAKHYEHRVKDYAAAERYTLLAMERAYGAVEHAELEHRLNRVRAKAERRAASAG
jgi:tetratricopeptide (TPR) repeat protein